MFAYKKEVLEKIESNSREVSRISFTDFLLSICINISYPGNASTCNSFKANKEKTKNQGQSKVKGLQQTSFTSLHSRFQTKNAGEERGRVVEQTTVLTSRQKNPKEQNRVSRYYRKKSSEKEERPGVNFKSYAIIGKENGNVLLASSK